MKKYLTMAIALMTLGLLFCLSCNDDTTKTQPDNNANSSQNSERLKNQANINPKAIPDEVDGQLVPESVGGYQVVFVATHDNTEWLQPDEVLLILYAGKDVTIEESIEGFHVPENLPDGWHIHMVGGSGLSFEETQAELVKKNEELNKVHKEIIRIYGEPIKLIPSSSPMPENSKQLNLSDNHSDRHE